MIAFRDVTLPPLRGVSFALTPGQVARVVTDSEVETDLVLRLLLGTARPESGDVALFGRPPADLGEEERGRTFRRVGVVRGGGGLISNLKAWENLLLPLWYHGDRGAARREGEVVDLLGRLGVDRDRLPVLLQSLPGQIPLRERTFLGAVRAMLSGAELVVYVNLLEGLDDRSRGRLLALAAWYHGAQAGRATLHLGAAAGYPLGTPPDLELKV